MPESAATLDLFAEDVSAQSWEDLVEDLLPEYGAMMRMANDPKADWITPTMATTSIGSDVGSSHAELQH
jgi:hypothetical protein